MQDAKKQTLLFAAIARDHPGLKEWLERELQAQIDILVVNPLEHSLRQSQGSAQTLRKMLKLLEESPDHVRRMS